VPRPARAGKGRMPPMREERLRVIWGVILVGGEDRIVLAKPAAERGTRAGEIVGKHVLLCHPEKACEKVQRALAFLRGGEGAAFRRMVVETRRDRRWENTYVALRDEGGNHLGAMVVTVDITERVRAEEERLAYTLRLEEKLEQARREYEDAVMASLVSLVTVLEARDPYTKGHSLRVYELAVKMAEHLYGVSRVSKEVGVAAQLHDIGKVGIRDGVLNKAGKLTEEEMNHIREHPVIGERIVGCLPYMGSVAGIVRHHHERFDGTGYPDRLAGDQIPLASRIIAIADAYDAMTSSRPYRGAMEPERVAANIREGAGSQFDPALVEVFLELFYSGTLG